MSLTAVVDAVLEQALPCHLVDPDLFFAEAPVDVERAKALCIDCPVRTTCLAGALARREPWGVWGGELVVSGVVVPTTTKSMSEGVRPAFAIAFNAAFDARSEVATPGSTMCRSRMPVRCRIQSLVVATIFSRSALVSSRGGT